MDARKLEQLKRALNLKTGAELTGPPGGGEEETRQPRQNSPRPEEEPVSSEEREQEVRQLLRKRLRTVLGTASGTRMETASRFASGGRDTLSGRLEEVLEGSVISNACGSFLLVRREYSVEWRHGDLELGAILKEPPGAAAWISDDMTLADMDWRETLFLDTETTGLAGGAGTVCFLIGIGKFTSPSVFRLDQCFMRDFDDEGAMLQFIDEEYPTPSALVSYNGKSFDLPLLRNRHVQHRAAFPWKHTPHFDLVHAVRRIWKRRLGDCSLAHVETRLLGVRRSGDIPGSMIPRIWLDFLSQGNPYPLRPVFYHHRMDILSLVTLAGYLARSLRETDGSGFLESEDRLSLLKQCIRKRDYERAVQVADTILECETLPPVQREAHELRCVALKRLGRAAEYVDGLWAWHHAFPEDLQAAYMLAGVMTNMRNLLVARLICEETLDKVQSAGSFYRDMAEQPERLRLEERLRRIRGRLQAAEEPGEDGLDLDGG